MYNNVMWSAVIELLVHYYIYKTALWACNECNPKAFPEIQSRIKLGTHKAYDSFQLLSA